jgi:DNA-binding GntR family transcriptional regulator
VLEGTPPKGKEQGARTPWSGFAPPASLPDAISDHLGRAIAEGQFQPGQRLVETQLCADLGVSRTPMREALRMLAAEGLVDISSRKGARVAELTKASVTDVFTVRSALESLAAELAASQHSVESVDELRDLNAKMLAEVRAGNARTFFELNNVFHRGVALMTRNTYLQTLQMTAAARSFRPLFLSLSGLPHLEDSVSDHERIVAAIGRGDASRARSEMQRHIRNAEQEALRILESVASSAVATDEAEARPS